MSHPLYRSLPSIILYTGAHRVSSFVSELTEYYPLYRSSPSVIPYIGAHRVAGTCAKYPLAISLSYYKSIFIFWIYNGNIFYINYGIYFNKYIINLIYNLILTKIINILINFNASIRLPIVQTLYPST